MVECTNSPVDCRCLATSPAAQCGQTSLQIASKSSRANGVTDHPPNHRPQVLAWLGCPLPSRRLVAARKPLGQTRKPLQPAVIPAAGQGAIAINPAPARPQVAARAVRRPFQHQGAVGALLGLEVLPVALGLGGPIDHHLGMTARRARLARHRHAPDTTPLEFPQIRGRITPLSRGHNGRPPGRCKRISPSVPSGRPLAATIGDNPLFLALLRRCARRLVWPGRLGDRATFQRR